MTVPELSGSLASVGLAPIAQLLSSLGKTGDVLIARGAWIGQVSLDRGRLIAAALEGEQGRAAVEFIATCMRDGDFEYSEGPPTLEADADLGSDALTDLARLASQPAPRWASSVPGPSAVPRATNPAADEDADVVLSRAAIRILLDIDGRRSVRDLAARHGLLRSCQALGVLYDLGLVHLEPVVPQPQPQPPRPPEQPVDGGSAEPADSTDRGGFLSPATRLRDALSR